jgi:sialate O-acetylesterase
MLRRFIQNGAQVAGVFWYQGCSDAKDGDSESYTASMLRLIRSMRQDFKNPSLPVVVVQISRVARNTVSIPGWNSIRDQQRLLPAKIKYVQTISTIDLALDDAIHISGHDAHRVGRRAAEAMAILKHRNNTLLPPIALQRVTVKRDPLTSGTNVFVSFRNVIGSLHASGRPTGFALGDTPDQATSEVIFRTEVDGDTVRLKTSLPPAEFHEKHLFYGFGANPHCNITDSADRSLPAFGPVLVFSPYVYAPMVTRLRTSALLPSAGKLMDLSYPSNSAALCLTVRTFDDNPWSFCSRHEELSAVEPEDRLVYFSSRIRCAEDMKVDILLGYDGPVKVWFDGHEIYYDPTGTNPARIDDVKLPVAMKTGDHEVLIALGSNSGKAWGIFLRYARKDVPRPLQRKGQEFYSTPQTLD